MYTTIQTSAQQIFAVVGSAYISERHSDEEHRYLLPLEPKFQINFEQALKTLRSAFCLR